MNAPVVKIDKIYLHAPILGGFKRCSYNSRATFNGAVMVVVKSISERKVLTRKRKLGLELFYLSYTCFQPYRTFIL